MAQEYVNPLILKQLEEYGENGLNYVKGSALLSKYVARKGTASESSAETVRSRLNRFGLFAFRVYGEKYDTFDAFLDMVAEASRVEKPNPDPLDILSDYAAWLKKSGQKPNQIRQLVKGAKQFLRSKVVGARIDNDDFRENVALPRQEFPDFEGTEKSQVVELLNSCKNQRLKTALMLYAAMGRRAVEGCALRHSDIDYENETLTFRAGTEKMRRTRTRTMTKELKRQLQLWEKIKYQPHQHVGTDGKRIWVNPKPHPDDLVLAFWHMEKKPKPSGIYDSIYDEYEALTNLMQMERKNGRRVITFHRLRAFAKTTIANLGYGDFADWWIGHGSDTYYRSSKTETMKVFRKIEPYLTFQDTEALEARGADIQSQLDEKDQQIKVTLDQNKMLIKMLIAKGVLKPEDVEALTAAPSSS